MVDSTKRGVRQQIKALRQRFFQVDKLPLNDILPKETLKFRNLVAYTKEVMLVIGVQSHIAWIHLVTGFVLQRLIDDRY